MEFIAVAVVFALIGFFVAKLLLKKNNTQIISQAEEEAKKIIQAAENKHESIKQGKILEAKEKFLKLKTEFEEDTSKRKNQLKEQEQSLKEKSSQLTLQVEKNNTLKEELDNQKKHLSSQLDHISKKKQELERNRADQIAILEKISNLSAQEATEKLIKELKDEAQSKASEIVRTIEDEAKLTATKKAKKIVIETIQRTAAEHTIENCISVFNIESDDVKGKIIGREGRNIRTLESVTGVEFIVDDTPEAIIISGFDPVRREIARIALQRLVSDGRIHPARIEEVVNKVKIGRAHV